MTREQWLEIWKSCKKMRAELAQMNRLKVTKTGEIENEVRKIEIMIQDEIGQLDEIS